MLTSECLCAQICSYLKLPAKRSNAPKNGGTVAVAPTMRGGTMARHGGGQGTERIYEVRAELQAQVRVLGLGFTV